MTVIREHFNYVGKSQTWTVPAGVTSAYFECWGAAGGLASGTAGEGKVNQLVGGTAAASTKFTNAPGNEGDLGRSYSNNAGYVAGVRSVTAGQVYTLYVGGNGGPGRSAIKQNKNGSDATSLTGGKGGYNGGGAGGHGALVTQNLYNSTSTKVDHTSGSIPNTASKGDLWLDTSVSPHIVRVANAAYTAGNGTMAKWDRQTALHPPAVGQSGGGGGGATDIRFGGTDVANRIMVAGGSGGQGGAIITTGTGAWTLTGCPATPAPPFGNDSTATGASGEDGALWASSVNYYANSGFGVGGPGGGGPTPGSAPTASGGRATAGLSGGQATGRHASDKDPAGLGGSAGGGGQNDNGGSAGVNATAGTQAFGGVGANATGGDDGWAAGGGGGGGGWYGGGGGGYGFWAGGATRGGGGGGGSNYIDQSFTSPTFAGCARPPAAAVSTATGATGLGGFARISYNVAPKASWLNAPAAVVATSPFTVSIGFTGGATAGHTAAGIDHFIVGVGTVGNSAPDTQTTVVPTDPSNLSWTFPAGTVSAGNSKAIFVKVVDTDGDTSGWAVATVQGVTSAQAAPVTITSPAAGANLTPGPVAVAWTNGSNTPVIAYRADLSGTDAKSTTETSSNFGGWHAGGSRVNLFRDPGFMATVEWPTSTSQTASPGVSGHSGAFAWVLAQDGSAKAVSAAYSNLYMDGTVYRVHFDIASATANDTRKVEVAAYDSLGLLDSTVIDFSATAANTLLPVELVIAPRAQGVYFQVTPSDSAGEWGNSEAGQITYLANGLIELQPTDVETVLPPYFDGAHLNGNTGSVAWAGTTNASASILTNTSATSATIPYTGGPLVTAQVAVTVLDAAQVIAGYSGTKVTQTVAMNATQPALPTVTLTVNNDNGYMRLDLNAADGSATSKTTSFDVYRNGVRVAKGLVPDSTSRLVTYYDTPASGETATYTVRAWSQDGGYRDQTDGTVLVS